MLRFNTERCLEGLIVTDGDVVVVVIDRYAVVYVMFGRSV